MKPKSAVLLGAGIGDSLGMFAETMTHTNPKLMAWDGKSCLPSEYHKAEFYNGKFLTAGQYTDDTFMSIALAESILTCNSFVPAIAAKKYLEWFVGPNMVGIGKATRKALERVKAGEPWYNCGEENAQGNGTVMRVSPIGVFYRNEPSKLMRAAKLDAIITHDSYEAQQGSIAQATAISLLLNGAKKEDIIPAINRVLSPGKVLDNINVIMSNKLISDTIKNKKYDRELDKKCGHRIIAQIILGVKYTAVETTARALYVFLATNSFDEAMELVIRAGHDTDTAASLVGALAGSYYGLGGIPWYFIEQEQKKQNDIGRSETTTIILQNKDLLLEMDEKLYAAGN